MNHPVGHSPRVIRSAFSAIILAAAASAFIAAPAEGAARGNKELPVKVDLAFFYDMDQALVFSPGLSISGIKLTGTGPELTAIFAMPADVMAAARTVSVGKTPGTTTFFVRNGHGALVLVVRAAARAKIHLKFLWDPEGAVRAEEENLTVRQDGFLMHPVPTDKLEPGMHSVRVEENGQAVQSLAFEIRPPASH